MEESLSDIFSVQLPTGLLFLLRNLFNERVLRAQEPSVERLAGIIQMAIDRFQDSLRYSLDKFRREGAFRRVDLKKGLLHQNRQLFALDVDRAQLGRFVQPVGDGDALAFLSYPGRFFRAHADGSGTSRGTCDQCPR
jgi:hypothetical protein